MCGDIVVDGDGVTTVGVSVVMVAVIRVVVIGCVIVVWCDWWCCV